MKPYAILALSAALMLCACSDETVRPQKSPCVGIEGSPCGPKRPLNGKLNTGGDTASRALEVVRA